MTSLAGFRDAGEKFVLARLEQLFEEADIDEDVRKTLLDLNKKLSKAKLNIKKTKSKDSTKPKQPANGFMRFMEDCRKIQKDEGTLSKHLSDKLKKKVKEALKSLKKNENGNVSSSEMSSQMGKVWGSASDSEKKGYNDAFKSEKDKLAKSKEDSESEEEVKPKKTKPSKKEKSSEDTCIAKTGKGEPCNKKAKDGGKYCGTHKKLEEKEEEVEEDADNEEEEVDVEDDE